MASVSIYVSDTSWGQGYVGYVDGGTLKNNTIDYGETLNITTDDGNAFYFFAPSGATVTVTGGETASVGCAYADIMTVIPSATCSIEVSGT